jgi:hypothetical protein
MKRKEGLMQREYMEISWDQFEMVKRIVETIRLSIAEYGDIEIMKDGIIVRANRKTLTITVETEEEGR